jgi:cbb3-type cytochrome oxidase maturation protein
MTAVTAGMLLLAVWICFTILALVGIIAVFIWAVRARQFSSQDRARHLPLRSGIPPEVGAGGEALAGEQERKEGEG